MSSITTNPLFKRRSWQDQLKDYCRQTKQPEPVFNLVSDRRGGRTAWSSSVTIGANTYYARYFYDGAYTDNAKEDAAEVALMQLSAQVHSPTVYQGQLFPQQTPAYRGF
ncbi:hypothetical protein VTN31DRAFT_4152 [Thermomyces dupontii]|uniref:uncharacterized protein n=1 Tax=Talaromyces thermophilus TaxID=28565 RepID=UPI003743E6FF